MNAATTLDLSNAYANYVSNQKVEGNNGQNTSGRGRGPGLNNSKEARVDVDEVLEEIPNRHVKFATKLGTLLFVATIALIMLSRLLKTIRPLHSLPPLN